MVQFRHGNGYLYIFSIRVTIGLEKEFGVSLLHTLISFMLECVLLCSRADEERIYDSEFF